VAGNVTRWAPRARARVRAAKRAQRSAARAAKCTRLRGAVCSSRDTQGGDAGSHSLTCGLISSDVIVIVVVVVVVVVRLRLRLRLRLVVLVLVVLFVLFVLVLRPRPSSSAARVRFSPAWRCPFFRNYFEMFLQKKWR